MGGMLELGYEHGNIFSQFGDIFGGGGFGGFGGSGGRRVLKVLILESSFL